MGRSNNKRRWHYLSPVLFRQRLGTDQHHHLSKWILLSSGFSIGCNQIGASMKLAVMKTSAPPATVRLNGQTPTTPTSDDSVNIGILTDQPKSVEERIYLRWSTDFFITSHMVEAAGSGLNYSAAIPVQLAGTGGTGTALQHQRLISRRSSRRGQLTRLPWQPAATLTSWWLKEQTRARRQP